MVTPIPERVASLEADFRNLERRVSSHGGSLFGMQGNGGIQNDVNAMRTELARFIRDATASMDRFEMLLVGERGGGGLVKDVSDLKALVRRVSWLAKALGAAVLALLIEGSRRVIDWFAGR
jgi:hypothetical protein